MTKPKETDVVLRKNELLGVNIKLGPSEANDACVILGLSPKGELAIDVLSADGIERVFSAVFMEEPPAKPSTLDAVMQALAGSGVCVVKLGADGKLEQVRPADFFGDKNEVSGTKQ